LRRMKTTAQLPVLHSAARPPELFPYLDLDVQATAAYTLARGNAAARDCFRDYYEKPITI
ncbi:nucleotidyltransferase, partial [Paenibacillus sepulcri]|nr:nucleotidyltransferase [Paenibacillus sepulcri]